jgi:tetratricopeptide (TPR) repeat protein
VTNGPNLGQKDKAERDLKIAEDVVQSVLASQPANRAALLRAAWIANDRTGLARSSEHPEDEVAWARKTFERLEKFHIVPSDRSEAPRILDAYSRAEISLAVADPDEALRIGRQGSDLALSFNLPLQRAAFLMFNAEALRFRGELDQALKAAHEAVTLLEPGSGEASLAQAMNFVWASNEEGAILGEGNGVNMGPSLGRPNEAVSVLERAFNVGDVLVHKDPNDEFSRDRLSVAGAELAEILRHSDPRHALSVYDHVLQHLAEIRHVRMQMLEVNVLSESSYALRSLGRPAEARQRLDRAFAILRDFKRYPADKVEAGSEADDALRALADHEAETGNVARGIEIYQGLLDRLAAGGIKPEIKLAEAMDLSNIYGSIAALYRRSGRTDLASAFEKRRLELWRHWDRQLPNNPFVQRQIAAAQPQPERAR